MSADRYAGRRQRLIHALRKEDANTLLVTNETNVTYLTGFSGDSSHLLIGPELTLLVSDSRYTIQLKEECPDLDVYIRTNREPIVKAVGRVVKRAKLSKLAFESNATTYEQWQKLKEEAKQLELTPLSDQVEKLRLTKDASEVAEIREAIRQAERGFNMMRASLIDEMSELEAAHDLEHAMRRFGATSAGFAPVVAAGARAALPHARPTSNKIGSADFLLVDWGASTPAGYKCDLTRVLVTGKILLKLEKIYKVVLQAQRRGIAAIRPGAHCRDVDGAARRVIERAGFGKNFGHGLGHGIGLEIHEGPRMSPIADTELEAGMVVTVEPGIYLPGWGGVRIEDDVLVTRDGHEVLTSVVKEFEQIVVA